MCPQVLVGIQTHDTMCVDISNQLCNICCDISQEQRANLFHFIPDQDEELRDVLLSRLQDGNILVFQQGKPDVSPDCLPAWTYFAQFKLD